MPLFGIMPAKLDGIGKPPKFKNLNIKAFFLRVIPEKEGGENLGFVKTDIKFRNCTYDEIVNNFDKNIIGLLPYARCID